MMKKRDMVMRSLLLAALLCGGAMATLWFACPFPREALQQYPAAVQLLDADGQPLRTVYGGREMCCYPVPLADSGAWAWKALVAAEDKRFFTHRGIDPIAVARAVVLDARRGRVVSGASTISTQLIRLMQPRSRTLPTKVIEAFRALQLETIVSKQAILEQYLNRAPFGANLTGIEAASRRYFNKHARDLTLAESAMLIGMLPSPSRYRPDRRFDRASIRMEYVLDKMMAAGFVSAQQRETARAQNIAIVPAAKPFAAPHFCDMLLASRGAGLWAARDSNANVRTTLEPRIQHIAETALDLHARMLQAQRVFGGAVVVLDVRSGAVKALVGSPDYFDVAHAGQVNGAVALRSPGSALKPFAYAQAFERGIITPATVLGDVPIRFPDYAPRNIDQRFSGLVSARAALVQSLNIPALAVARDIGLDSFVATLRTLGLSSINKPASHYGLSIVLGTTEVRLLDVANAYACLARGGQWMPCRTLAADPVPLPQRVLSQQTAWLVSDVLADDARLLAYTGSRDDANRPRVALKTGTSSARRDAWAVMYNPEYVVAVWVGNPEGESSEVLGGITAAAPMAYDIFRQLYPAGDAPWFRKPEGIDRRAVCAISGRPVGPHCRVTATDWCVPGVSDPAPCSVHQLRPFDRVTGTMVALGDVHAERVEWKVDEVWPAEIAAYLHEHNASRQSSMTASAAKHLRIVSPSPGTTYCRTFGAVNGSDTIQLRAESGSEVRTCFWFVDNTYLGASFASDGIAWQLEKGKHIIACADTQGRSASAAIIVE